MKREKKKWQPKVTNIMADGTVVEDLTGYVIPRTATAYYACLKSIIEERLHEKEKICS